MNLSLLDPFAVAKEYPESLTDTIEFGFSIYIRFNYNGDYLASGLNDGNILIFDLQTLSPLTILRKHTKQIQSLTWSFSNRYLLSSAKDNNVILWDLKFSKVLRIIIFESLVWNSQFLSNNPYIIIASSTENDCRYIDCSDEFDYKYIDLQNNPLFNVNDSHLPPKSNNLASPAKYYTLSTAFAYDGNYIFNGTTNGWLNIEINIVYSQKITNNNIKSIVISSNNSKMFINSTDRIIRQFTLPNLSDFKSLISNNNFQFEVDHKYQDVVNKLQWNAISINYNGDYLVASTYGSNHEIYMWETSMGSLIKILEGPKEELLDVDWNFKKNKVSATGVDSGTIYIWSIIINQKWSSLAPDFIEIDENIDYIERENEFDILPDEEINLKRQNDENEFIDVISKDNDTNITLNHNNSSNSNNNSSNNNNNKVISIQNSSSSFDNFFIIPVDLDQKIELPVYDDDD
ncbi:COMPASS subunit protein SWD1 [Ascoidea rubescens DSM 1968]|uniref:WD40 repeat-like protein n=1 Tax=Ascoidea rubescens DSM 1968 TaxID=1344418 RepID=A0A1D2VDW5_9ASCO|nr:WD40 repeat-like protein [Ascoidea rubescens DSM 1968]ODV59884.1 WD40 repeat-like protein [Ascoidea rubescens DSM 1968]